MGFGQKLYTVHSLSTIIASHCSLRKYTWHLNLNFHSVPFSYKCFKEAFKHIFHLLYDKYFIIENYKQWKRPNLPIMSSKQQAHSSAAAISSSSSTLVRLLSGNNLFTIFLSQKAIMEVRAIYAVDTAKL